jgi:hypothetical protein
MPSPQILLRRKKRRLKPSQPQPHQQQDLILRLPKAKQPSLLHLQKPKIRKPKLLRSNPTRISLYLNDDPKWFYVDDEDILSGYRTPNVSRRDKDLEEDDTELSEHVRFRLWLARQLALKKYHEKWG